jgi:uncharacterized protein (TIRG00374 family)
MNKPTLSDRSINVNVAFIGSVLTGAIILIGFLCYVGLGRIISAIQKISPIFILATFALSFLSLVLYSLAWHVLIHATGHNVSFRTCLSTALAAIFACYVTPGGFLMEAIRILLITKKSEMKMGEGAATVIMHKILYALGFTTCAVISLLVLIIWYAVPYLNFYWLLILLISVFGSVAALAYFSVNIAKLDKIAFWALSRLKPISEMLSRDRDPASLRDSIHFFFTDFQSTFRKLSKDFAHLLKAFAITISCWLTFVGILYTTFIAMNYRVSIWVVTLAIVVGEFIQMTPIGIPGMMGVLEATLTATLVILGVPVAVAAPATILARIATYWFNIPITGVAASFYGMKYVIEGIGGSANRPLSMVKACEGPLSKDVTYDSGNDD